MGNVELLKVDQDGKLLSGVEFELYKVVQDKEEKVGDKYTTDANGKIAVNNLEYGNYKFVEIKPLEGYEKLKEPVTFTIKGSELISLEVKNTKIKPEEPTKPEEQLNRKNQLSQKNQTNLKKIIQLNQKAINQISQLRIINLTSLKTIIGQVNQQRTISLKNLKMVIDQTNQ